ncbi:MOZ/SAS family [Musa troglodytarum]|uniref:Histone acetyltransferase n=1 Tax=Musa troglodytarum TaxID=320322 RepID=A0A9E7IC45_9LILI|nr:MOZ/SAS family [Musa troglodytarum]
MDWPEIQRPLSNHTWDRTKPGHSPNRARLLTKENRRTRPSQPVLDRPDEGSVGIDGGAAAGGRHEGDVPVAGSEAPPPARSSSGGRSPTEAPTTMSTTSTTPSDKLQNDTSSERKLMRHMLRYSYAKRDRSISFGRGNCIHDSKEQTICSSLHGHEELDAASLREHEEFTEVKNIAKIELGRYKIDIWYFSPFPPKCSDSPKLFFCEFCFKFMKRKELLQRHTRKCDLKHPPGDEIYRSGSLSMFEVSFIFVCPCISFSGFDLR